MESPKWSEHSPKQVITSYADEESESVQRYIVASRSKCDPLRLLGPPENG